MVGSPSQLHLPSTPLPSPPHLLSLQLVSVAQLIPLGFISVTLSTLWIFTPHSHGLLLPGSSGLLGRSQAVDHSASISILLYTAYCSLVGVL